MNIETWHLAPFKLQVLHCKLHTLLVFGFKMDKDCTHEAHVLIFDIKYSNWPPIFFLKKKYKKESKLKEGSLRVSRAPLSHF
jgi:hypothetical protein